MAAACFRSHKIICEIISPFRLIFSSLVVVFFLSFPFMAHCYVSEPKNLISFKRYWIWWNGGNIYRFDWITLSGRLLFYFGGEVIDWGLESISKAREWTGRGDSNRGFKISFISRLRNLFFRAARAEVRGLNKTRKLPNFVTSKETLLCDVIDDRCLQRVLFFFFRCASFRKHPSDTNRERA